MARKSQGKSAGTPSNGRWIRLCFQCWMGPLLFLASTPYLAQNSNDDKTQDLGDHPHLGAAAAVLGPLLGIVSASLSGVIASLVGCSPYRVAPVQWAVQVAIILYALGLINFSLAPIPGSLGEAPSPSVPSKNFLEKSQKQEIKSPNPSPENLGTMSVVLPCLNEPYAYKTVMKFCERTPPEAGLFSR